MGCSTPNGPKSPFFHFHRALTENLKCLMRVRKLGILLDTHSSSGKKSVRGRNENCAQRWGCSTPNGPKSPFFHFHRALTENLKCLMRVRKLGILLDTHSSASPGKKSVSSRKPKKKFLQRLLYMFETNLVVLASPPRAYSILPLTSRPLALRNGMRCRSLIIKTFTS
jgi:hypothetical protein